MPASGKMAAPPQQETVQPRVLAKLVTFAILTAAVPISTYFACVKHFWPGNTTYAAIAAVIAANTVLVGYVYLAFAEDAQEQAALPEKKRE